MDIRGYYFHLIVLICLLRGYAKPVPASDIDTISENVPNGKFLTDLGTNFSSPLLRLIGKTFRHYEDDIRKVEQRLTEKLCQLHPCTDWGSWTDCPAVARGQFSMVTRTRVCSRNDDICANNESTELPTEESKVCEGWCPETYNDITGYCLKFFSTSMSQYDAMAACLQDNGHLVNIDSQAKSDAVHAILKAHSYTGTIWINGNRKKKGGDWQFTYGSVPDFDNWKSGEPSNGSGELCKVEEDAVRKWFDRGCSSTYFYMCELV